MTLRDALRICFRREHLSRTIKIALVVGTVLTLINQLDVIVLGGVRWGSSSARCSAATAPG